MPEFDLSSYCDDFNNDGFTIVRRLFSDNLCTEINSDAFPQLNNHNCVTMPFRTISSVLKLFHSTIFKEMLSALLGQRRPMLFGGEYFHRPPGQTGFPAHVDNQDFRLNDHRDAVIVWIALEPVDYVNGGLKLYPGSHRVTHSPEPLEYRSSNRPDIVYWGIKDDQLKLLNMPVQPAMNTGDCLFFSSNLVHSSTTNISTVTRRSIQLSFIAEGADARPGVYQNRVPIDIQRLVSS